MAMCLGAASAVRFQRSLSNDFFDLQKMFLLFAQFAYLCCCLCAPVIRELYKCLINKKKKKNKRERKKEKTTGHMVRVIR